ncbi:hypothetical protein YPPY03_1667, partial [Yersinia pestis PY-03]
MDSA